MEAKQLEKVLSALIELKATMHDAANTSAVRHLDEAIELVQQGITDEATAQENALLALIAVGKVLAAIPKIADVIKTFFD